MIEYADIVADLSWGDTGRQNHLGPCKRGEYDFCADGPVETTQGIQFLLMARNTKPT